MDCPPGQKILDPSIGCVPEDPSGFVSTIYGWGLGLLGMVAVLFLIVGGFIILTSQGDPTKLQKGKEYIFYSIAGLLLALFGYVFMRLITVDILKIPGFG